MDPNTASVFGGVVSKDGLPKTIDALPIAFVCNTDDGDEPGEHWIALYLSSDGRGEYFCSYGLPPLHAVFSAFLNKHCSEWTHNSKRLQSPWSNVCGQYCVTYIMFRCNGSPMRTFVNAFRTDLVANDCRVFDWINLLKKGTPYYRTSYWTSGEVETPVSSRPLARWSTSASQLIVIIPVVFIRTRLYCCRYDCIATALFYSIKYVCTVRFCSSPY